MDFTTYDCQVTCIARPLVREWLAPLLPAVPGEQQIGIDVAMMPWGATEGDLLEVAPWIIYLSIYLLIWSDMIWSDLVLSYPILSYLYTVHVYIYVYIYMYTHTPFGPTLPHILYKCQPVGFSQTHLFQLDRSRSLCCEFKSTLPVTTFEGQPVNPHRNTRKQKKN